MAIDEDNRPYAYDGVQVVEIANDLSGEITGKLMAHFGATVLKVEPLAGSPSRRIGPFASGEDAPENSLTYWYYNTSKQSVVLDLPDPQARRGLDDLLADADIVILSGTPAESSALGVDPDALVAQFPHLIVCVITPFGLDGPWVGYQSSDLVALAGGGLLNLCGYDDHEIPPIRPAENHAYQVAASFAHTSILLALIEREISGHGQMLDLSIHDSIAVGNELSNPFWFYPRALVQRQTCRHAEPTLSEPALFQTADGRYVHFVLVLADSKPWHSLVAWMAELGVADDLTDTAYSALDHRQKNFPHVQSLLVKHFLGLDANTIYREGQRHGLPIAVVNSADEVLDDEHLLARGFFETVSRGRATAGKYPGAPMRFSSYRPSPQRPAPRLGEHQGAVR
jgi:crotonobetainyl-CoA:carnitine CoA-transferase CaiB-like acyl-CoA transferase